MADICYLTDDELGRLRYYGIPISHDQHRHISHAEAIQALLIDQVIFVRDVTNAVTDNPDNVSKSWRHLPSAGYTVKQLVRDSR